MLRDHPVKPTLPCVDLKRAREFYEERLGFRVLEFSDFYVIYECGGGTVLIVYERPEATKAEHTEVLFTVEDLEKEMEELGARGIVFEEYDMPHIKTVDGVALLEAEQPIRIAWFKDPEGNIIGVEQRSF